MPLTGHGGIQCQAAKPCQGRVVTLVPPPALPDHWVRIEANASWRCSKQPPTAAERAATGWRCPLCGATFRVVEPSH